MQVSPVHPLFDVTHLAVLLELPTFRDLSVERILIRSLHVESLLLLSVEFLQIFSGDIGVPLHLVPEDCVVDQPLRCLVLELRLKPLFLLFPELQFSHLLTTQLKIVQVESSG